jgi:hypothetical protein
MAQNLTINKVRTNQIVISIEYNDAGLATGASISAQGHKLSDAGEVVASLEKSWDYSSIPPTLKADIKGVVQASTRSMSQEIGETDEVELP